MDLIFLCIISGVIGGVVCMNVGCYGFYIVDVFVLVKVVIRVGEFVMFIVDDLNF